MRLVIKFPTRNRPEKFKQVFTKYREYLSGKHPVHFIITMDSDDNTMNNPEIKAWLDEQSKLISLEYHYGNSKTKIEAVNANLENVEGDVLLLASDDMIPVQKGYDLVIAEAYSLMFPDFHGAIKFWDGLRPQEDPLMTLSVMGVSLFKEYGYIYHPAYKSVFCDNEQTMVLQRRGVLAICYKCIIKHAWSKKFDELHDRNESRIMYMLDKKTFMDRLAKDFQ